MAEVLEKPEWYVLLTKPIKNYLQQFGWF